MKKSRFFIFLFITMGCLLWAVHCFAFYPNWLWQSDVIQVFDCPSVGNNQSIGDQDILKQILGFQSFVYSPKNTTTTGAMAFEIACGDIDHNIITNEVGIDGNFYPLNLTCTDFLIENVSDEAYSCFNIFYTENFPTSTLSIYNGFTYGEIIISFFLFLIVLMLFFGFIFIRFLGIKIKRKLK